MMDEHAWKSYVAATVIDADLGDVKVVLGIQSDSDAAYLAMHILKAMHKAFPEAVADECKAFLESK